MRPGYKFGQLSIDDVGFGWEAIFCSTGWKDGAYVVLEDVRF